MQYHNTHRLGGSEAHHIHLFLPDRSQAGVLALLVGEREKLADSYLTLALRDDEPAERE